MNFRKWAIVKFLPNSEWVQFISNNQPPHIWIYNGKSFYQTPDDIAAQPLPIGLTGLGFTKVSPEGSWPATLQDRKGNVIIEREPNLFFVDEQHVLYTHEIQEAFDLYFQIDATEGYERLVEEDY
jgi:hypothetical protein